MREILGDLLFGGTCFLCRGRASALLCARCEEELPRPPIERCPRCALGSPGGAVCGRCLAEPPAYDATVAALVYDFPVDALVHALKFRGELAAAPLLGRLLAAAIGSDSQVDRVVAVPLAAKRLQSRGYNQALEIARRLPVSRVDAEACIRPGNAVPQTELPWAERRKNVRAAFSCTRRLAGETVAVVDDVMTTGATLDEMARTLKDAGAARVVNWIVARTLPPSS